ncbi:MAG: hypothetical protein R2708_06200 [Vicinamibacterales bacterium]
MNAPSAGRVAVAGEVTATYGSSDPGFFNYATYAYDPLRNVRVLIDASVRPSRGVELLAQLRTDGLSEARLAALYVRLRPWQRHDVDLQVGRVPTAFGLFGRNGYGSDATLVGRPLAYSYLLSLRRDALPASAADLIRMRGRGWLSEFPLGNPAPDRGLPIVNADTWDTGAQVRLGLGRLEWAGAVTVGSLGSPRLNDDNDARSLTTRLVVHAAPGVTFGASAARGGYLDRRVAPDLSTGQQVETFTQRAGGADVEVSAGRWLARGEVLVSRWDVPAFTADAGAMTLGATAGWAEGRVRVLPGLDLGARIERLSFSEIDTAAGRLPWEAAVTRVETGVAWVPARHVRVKVAAQRNRRPAGGRIRHDTLLAAQLGLWF